MQFFFTFVVKNSEMEQEYKGYNIYPYKVGDKVFFAVQSNDNLKKGIRQGFGDSVVETIEKAKMEVDFQIEKLIEKEEYNKFLIQQKAEKEELLKNKRNKQKKDNEIVFENDKIKVLINKSNLDNLTIGRLNKELDKTYKGVNGFHSIREKLKSGYYTGKTTSNPLFNKSYYNSLSNIDDQIRYEENLNNKTEYEFTTINSTLVKVPKLVYDYISFEQKELQKGIQVEQEHKETLEKVASGEISVDEAIKETAVEHIKENPNYYDELEKIEKKDDFDLFLDNIEVVEYREQGVPYALYELSYNGDLIIKGLNVKEKEANLDKEVILYVVKNENSGLGLMTDDFRAKALSLLPNKLYTYNYFINNISKKTKTKQYSKEDFSKVVSVETKSTPIEKPITYINTKNFDCIEKGQYDFSKVDIMNRDKENDTIIYVNPKEINKRYRSDYPNFTVSEDKLKQVKNFLLEELPDCSEKQVNGETLKTMFTAPIVKFDDKSKLFIEDGRHRLLVAEQMGFNKFPIQVPKGQVGMFEKIEENTVAEIINQQFNEVPQLEEKETVIESNSETLEAIEMLKELDSFEKDKEETQEAINMLKELLEFQEGTERVETEEAISLLMELINL